MYKNTIKKEKDVFKKDLSNTEGSYTKELNDNINLINDMANDVTVDLKTYIKRVLEIIEPAHDTTAKRNFIYKLQTQPNKIKAVSYVTDAWLKGSGLGVI